MQEVRNAVDQANREASTRYDFKGTESEIDLGEKGTPLCVPPPRIACVRGRGPPPPGRPRPRALAGGVAGGPPPRPGPRRRRMSGPWLSSSVLLVSLLAQLPPLLLLLLPPLLLLLLPQARSRRPAGPRLWLLPSSKQYLAPWRRQGAAPSGGRRECRADSPAAGCATLTIKGEAAPGPRGPLLPRPLLVANGAGVASCAAPPALPQLFPMPAPAAWSGCHKAGPWGQGGSPVGHCVA